jgi:hypothetical protein
MNYNSVIKMKSNYLQKIINYLQKIINYLQKMINYLQKTIKEPASLSVVHDRNACAKCLITL